MTNPLSDSPDFSALRQAVREAADSLDSANSASLELITRTQHLARLLDREQALSAGSLSVLVFQLGSGEQRARYAWPIRAVHGLLHVEHLTPIPSAPLVYRGLVNWRGTVLAALDLRGYFGQPIPPDPARWLMVIGAAETTNGLKLGVLADDVFDLSTIQTADLSPLPDSSGGLVRGITSDKLLLLDADQLIAREAARSGKARA